MRQAFASVLVLGILAAVPADADHRVASARPSVTLLDGWRLEDGSRIAAIEISLAPGWHTYWRVPGEAGIPPVFDWSGSGNLGSVSYEWPRPSVFESFGLRTFGYRDGLILPVRLTPKDPALPMAIALDVDFGMCDDICEAAADHVTAQLDPDTPPADRAHIEQALAQRPVGPEEAGVSAVSCRLVADGAGFAVTADIVFANPPSAEQIGVIETSDPGLWIGEAESRVEGRMVRVRAPLESASTSGPVLDRSGLRLTLLDGARAVDIRGCGGPAG